MTIQLLYTRIALIGMLAGLISSSNLLAQPVQARPLGSPTGNSSSAAVRGACPALDTNLQNRALLALLDNNDPTLTTQAAPTFWIYLPFTRTEEVTTAEFELLDKDQNSVLGSRKIKISLPEKAGIAHFTLPSNEKPLEVGQEYFWVFRVVCDQDDRSGNPTVTGWLKRVAPETALVSQLKSMPASDQYKAYAENNIWFEQINLLAQHRTQHNQEWTALLTTFGLQNFAQQPIAELKVEEIE